MSKAAFSSKVFAIYLFVIAPLLVFAPNAMLGLFGIAPTSEVWIRVVGVIAFNLGVYSWVAAKHDSTAFLAASVYTRCSVFVAFAIFGGLGLVSPMIILFGLVDLAGAVWTYLSLKADAQTAGRLA
jgi:hypothetical protein